MTDKQVRKPKQKRSIQMKEKILETAEVLFCKKGYFETTTNEIAKVANISIGSLYSYFSDKDTILTELLDRHHRYFMSIFDEIQTEANAQFGKEDRREWLRWLVNKLITMHETKKDFLKELNVLYYAKPEVAALLDERSEIVRAAILNEQLKNYREPNVDDIEAASIIIFDFVSAIVDRIVFRNNEIDNERIIETGIDMLYRSLVAENK